MRDHNTLSIATLAAASRPASGIVAFALAAFIGLALGTGSARAYEATAPTICFDLDGGILQSAYNDFSVPCDDMRTINWGSG